MIHHVWSVLASKSVIDGETQLISIHDVADTLNIEGKKSELVKDGKKPVEINVPIQSEVVSMYYKTSKSHEDAKVRLELIDPQDKKLSEFDQSIQLTKPFLRARIKINGLAVTKSGIYKMRISLKNKIEEDYQPVAEIPYMVNLKLQ